MSFVRKHSKQKQVLKKFRLTAANLILERLADIDVWGSDMQGQGSIAELCEQYSLLIVLNWLAGKNDFPAYKDAIDADSSRCMLPLSTWTFLRQRFPLHQYHATALIAEIYAELESFMDQSFTPELELAGCLHEQMLAAPLLISDRNHLHIDLQSEDRISGEYYTPPWVTDYAFGRWLSADSSSILNRFKSENISDLPAIFDPACGSGNFLLAALRCCRKLGLSSDRILAFARDCLYGGDIDGKAVELCKLSILIATAPELNALPAQEQKHCIESLLLAFDKHFRISNSILEFCASQSSCDQDQFDLLISNPPYLSFGSRDQNRISNDWQRYLKSRFPAASEYKLRYTSLFQEFGIEKISSSELPVNESLFSSKAKQCIFLVPDAFLTGSYYGKLREAILNKVDIVELSELPENTISGAVVGRWCLAHYRSKESPDSSRADISLRSVSFDGQKLLAEEFSLPLVHFVSKDKSRFQLVFSREDLELVKLFGSHSFLKDGLRGHTGIRSRLGQKAIISPECKSALHKRGIVSGSELRPYSVEWRGNWLEIDRDKLFSGGFDERVVSGPKVMVRQTGDRLLAAVDLSGLYHLNNVHSFVPKPEESREALTYFYACLLNSSLFLYFYRLKTREFKRALAQVDIETVEHMPLPDLQNQKNSIDNLSRLGRMLSESGSNNETLLEEVDDEVFELYSLSSALKRHVLTSV